MKSKTVKIDGELVPFTYSQFKVIEMLMRKAKWVFSRKQLIACIRGEFDYPVTEKSIDVLLVTLRRKLKNKKLIETVNGFGYKFTEETEVIADEDVTLPI